MIKLIASDIDGTLVREGAHEIDPAYYDVIRELKEAGITFCACSGRQYPSMLDLFAPVADDIYFISNNGTLIRTKKEVLHSWKIEKDSYDHLLRELRKISGGDIIVETADEGIIDCSPDSPFAHLLRDEYHYKLRYVDDILSVPADHIIKVSIHHPRVNEVTGGLRSDPRLQHLSMTISGAMWLDITPQEAGKGEAYALLQEFLEIRQEETVYFGDNLNDLSAFEEAGVTATVANARHELQDAADIVERSYDDRGVLRELRNILGHARAFQKAQDC